MKQTNKQRKCPKCGKHTLLEIIGQGGTSCLNSDVSEKVWLILEGNRKIDYPINKEDRVVCTNCYAAFK